MISNRNVECVHKANERIYLSPPDVGPLEAEAVSRAVLSGWVAPLGPEVEEFDREIADLAGRSHGVSLASGTAGLHLSLLALGVKPGEIVLCPTLTFVATVNAIAYTGAVPVLVDSDFETGNISPSLLREAIQELLLEGKKVAGVVAVDFLGKCADYDGLLAVTSQHGMFLLADSAESVGSTYQGTPAGKFGAAAVFSFNGNKLITTSGGGAVVSDDESLIGKIRFLARQARDDAVHYEHSQLGFNYRLSNVLAALGRVQLSRLDSLVVNRRRIRRRYVELFANAEHISVLGHRGEEDNCWLTSIIVDPLQTGWGPLDLLAHLEADNIESRPLWKPMHLQPLYREVRTFLDGSAEAVFARGLALPSGSSMDEAQWARVEASIRLFLGLGR